MRKMPDISCGYCKYKVTQKLCLSYSCNANAGLWATRSLFSMQKAPDLDLQDAANPNFTILGRLVPQKTKLRIATTLRSQISQANNHQQNLICPSNPRAVCESRHAGSQCIETTLRLLIAIIDALAFGGLKHASSPTSDFLSLDLLCVSSSCSGSQLI